MRYGKKPAPVVRPGDRVYDTRTGRMAVVLEAWGEYANISYPSSNGEAPSVMTTVPTSRLEKREARP